MDAGNIDELAKITAFAECVIADVGHRLTRDYFRALEKWNPKVRRIVYYDNRESFVPGEYSKYVAELLRDANVRPNRIVFANKTMDEIFDELGQSIDLTGIERVGLGYLNMKQVNAIQKMRPCRKEFFDWLGREDKGELILTYFGGANEVYFNHAFPRFQKIVKDLDNVIILFQPHPRSGQREVEGMILSTFSFEKAAAFADIGLYYQTSASPTLLLAGVPLIQVGHQPFNELCVREGLIPVCGNIEDLNIAIQKIRTRSIDFVKLRTIIGYDPDWPEGVENALQ